MSTQYHRFLKVLEKWPADKVKVGRDLGEQIRKQLKNLTNPSSLTNEANDKLKLQIDALERITNNTYAKQNLRTQTSTATGLTAEQCNQVLSSEFMQYLSDDKDEKDKKKKSI